MSAVGKRILGCVLTGGMLLASLTPTPARAGIANSEFIVTPFGGNSVVLNYSELTGLSPDVANQSYRVISKPGAKARSLTISSGYSLQEILDAAGMGPVSFGYVELTAFAESTLLTAAQAVTPPTSSDFPVFFEDGTDLDFADANPADFISGRGLFYVNLFPGPRLAVKVKASTSTPTAGQRVRVTASVRGQAPGEHLGFEWDDGTGLTYGGGNPLIQPFELPGTYYAYAVVTGSKGSVGISPVISIKVAKAPKPPRRESGGKR